MKMLLIKHMMTLLLSLNCLIGHAKVAYIPLFDASSAFEVNNSILAVNLATGRVLKNIVVGEGVSAIFINSANDLLYAGAAAERKIVQIDTSVLNTTESWSNLPIEPEQIMLNPMEDKLIFGQRNQDNIYQIDFNTGLVSVAVTVAGFQSFHYSDNLEYVVMQSRLEDDYELFTYEVDSFNLVHRTAASRSRPMLVSNDGTNFLTFATGYGALLRSLTDNSLIWEFRHGSGLIGPFGELSETFTTAYLFNETTLLLNGSRGGTYLVDKGSGSGSRISELDNPYNQNTQINDLIFLQSNRPQQIICPPIVHCPGRGLYHPLVLEKHHYQDNSREVIYYRPESGNVALGRYIGELFYSVPKVPALNLVNLMLLVLTTWLLSIKFIKCSKLI